MSTKNKSKEIKINKLGTKVEKIDKKAFERINEQFRKYWKYLFSLIFIYIISYAF
jgi:aspartyl/asparaginyl beta-hydroxylase (cupin superfamily)